MKRLTITGTIQGVEQKFKDGTVNEFKLVELTLKLGTITTDKGSWDDTIKATIWTQSLWNELMQMAGEKNSWNITVMIEGDPKVEAYVKKQGGGAAGVLTIRNVTSITLIDHIEPKVVAVDNSPWTLEMDPQPVAQAPVTQAPQPIAPQVQQPVVVGHGVPLTHQLPAAPMQPVAPQVQQPVAPQPVTQAPVYSGFNPPKFEI